MTHCSISRLALPRITMSQMSFFFIFPLTGKLSGFHEILCKVCYILNKIVGMSVTLLWYYLLQNYAMIQETGLCWLWGLHARAHEEDVLFIASHLI